MRTLLGDPVLVSPGLLLDTSVTVLRSEGIDVTKTGVILPVNKDTESRIEAMVTRKTICLLNGLESVPSYFDSMVAEKSTVSGSSYSVRGGRVQRHDFTITTPVQRTSDGLVNFDSSSLPLPGMASIADSTVLNTTAKGNSILFSPIFMYYQY